MKVQILGDVNFRGTVDVPNDKSILALLQEDAQGMADDKKLQLVQIGGPLGSLVWGKDLTQSVDNYAMVSPTVLFLNEKFCPVDFGKFMANYIKRELLIKNQDVQILADLLEELSSGKVREYTLLEFSREIQKPAQVGYVECLRENLRYLYTRFAPVFQEHFELKKCSATICHRLYSAQCINACPAGINIPGYIALMYAQKDELAYRLMRQKNPLSFICGKVCARPCESRCRRGDIEHTVGVRALKHYAASKTLHGDFKEDCLPPNGKTVAIVGSGPSGLSAAYYLAKAGYQVTVYEKNAMAGGMLAVGIPAYRLSQDSIDLEVMAIEKLGVTLKYNTEIGVDISFDDLCAQHNSVLLATGCQIANTFSDHLKNLQSALSFLRDVKVHQMMLLTSDRKIFPSPMCPVYSSFLIASKALSKISGLTTIIIICLGNKAISLYNSSSYSGVLFWTPQPITSMTVMPVMPSFPISFFRPSNFFSAVITSIFIIFMGLSSLKIAKRHLTLLSKTPLSWT